MVTIFDSESTIPCLSFFSLFAFEKVDKRLEGMICFDSSQKHLGSTTCIRLSEPQFPHLYSNINSKDH